MIELRYHCFQALQHFFIADFPHVPHTVHIPAEPVRPRCMARSCTDNVLHPYFRICLRIVSSRYRRVASWLGTKHAHSGCHARMKPLQCGQSSLIVPELVSDIVFIRMGHNRHPVACVLHNRFENGVPTMSMGIYESWHHDVIFTVDDFLYLQTFCFLICSHKSNPSIFDSYRSVIKNPASFIHRNNGRV